MTVPAQEPPRRLDAATLAQLEALFHLGDAVEPCPYLPKRVATFRFADGMLGLLAYRTLLDRGYRRNGAFIYRPVCSGCSACEVLRVPVATFRPSKSQRRVWNRGQEIFTVRVAAAERTPEKLRIYRDYLVYQHQDKDAEAATEHYEQFLVQSCLGGATFEVQLWAAERLAGVGVCDRLGDALSSVYFYFDPAFADYSPGTYSALAEIDLARRWGMTYYYLGYYIEPCRAMNYKARFRPCELKVPDAAAFALLAEGARSGEPGAD